MPLDSGLESLDGESTLMYGNATRTYKVDNKKEKKATSKGRRMPQVSPIMPPAVSSLSRMHGAKKRARTY